MRHVSRSGAERSVRRSAAVAAVCVTAVAAAVSTGSPASAAGGWSISPGGPFHATATPWKFADDGAGDSISCTSLNLGGQLTSGTNVPGPVIGTFGSAVVGACTGPLGIPFSLGFSGFPWSISPTGYNSSGDLVTGTVSGLRAHLSGAGCTADIAGASPGTAATLNFTYGNLTHVLVVSSSNAHYANASGSCLGLIVSGDAAGIGGSFVVQPGQTIRPSETPGRSRG